MKTILTLILTDLVATRRFLATQTLSKLLVILSFFLVFSGVSATIFLFTRSFFQSFAESSGDFGFLTASYMMNAAIVMTLWLAIGSTIASTLSFLFTPNKQVDFLMTLPIKTGNITLWFFIKSVILNLILLLIPFVPIALAFQVVFHGLITLSFLTRVAFVLALMVIVANSVGQLIGYYIAKSLKGKGSLMVISCIIFFFSTAAIILHLIFPSSLLTFYEQTSSDFLSVYNKLPLVNPFLPTTWLSQTIASGININSLYAFILALLLAFWANNISALRFVFLFQTLKTQPHLARKNKNKSFFIFTKTERPLLYKDWLSIVRLPSETGYGLFLLSLAFFFFLIISFSTNLDYSDLKLEVNLILFSMVWLFFFATSYLLRLVFPLIAREIEGAWYIFTLPISRRNILQSKINISLLLVIPLILLGIIIWFMLPFQKERVLLIVLNIWGILVLTITQALLGSIFPNFELGRDPEKVSTGTMGITTLIASIVITTIIAFTLYWFLKNTISAAGVVVIVFTFNVTLLSLLYLLSSYSLKRYEF